MKTSQLLIASAVAAALAVPLASHAGPDVGSAISSMVLMTGARRPLTGTASPAALLHWQGPLYLLRDVRAS